MEHSADLELAAACVAGDAGALARFDREHLTGVGTYVCRIDAAAQFAEEVRQRLRERLLVAPAGERPRIADYAGRGPLAGFVRAAAVRIAIDLKRLRTDEPMGPEEVAQLPLDAADPEVALVKARYRDAYQEALRDALGRLSPRERNLLRMSFVDGMTVDHIGVVYKVHRATAARWVADARQRVVDDLYATVAARLRLNRADLDSLTALVHSEIHLSLSRLLSSR
jgi:RNA polymerase sigma-70 factor (ECF subfamily)